jgi:thiol-disulfide isomerase/thioredoxin
MSGVPLASMVDAASASNIGTISPPTNLPPSTPALTTGGKPEILYMGAEYCPFCAAERWAMVMALSKFGSFSNLASTKSSSTDTNPNTPTFSFYGSTYTSQYLTFTPVEIQDRVGHKLQTPTTDQSKIINTYDATPYVSASAAGTIPFIDLGGRYLVSGTEYDGSALSNMSFNTAVGYMTSGTTTASKAAEAVAAHLIGVICSLTNNQPGSVCSAIPASLKTGVSGSGTQGSSSGG